MKRGSRQKADKSLTLFHGEAAASSIQNSGIAYQSPLMIAAGAGAQTIALFSSLTNLAFALLLIKMPAVIESRGALKKATLLLALCGMLGWVPLVGILLFFGGVSPYWMIPLWIASLLPFTMVAPVRDNWLARIIPSATMGKYLGTRTAISAAVYLGMLYLIGYVLNTYSGAVFTGYTLIFGIVLAAAIGAFFIYSRTPAPVVKAGDDVKGDLTFPGFLREISKEPLAKFILYISIFTFTVHICSPFFTIRMLRDLGLNYRTYTLILSAEYVARIIAVTFSGRYIDKFGSLKVLEKAAYILPVVPALWVFAGNWAYILGLQFISGMGWAAFDLATQTHIYRSARPHNLFRYIVYQKVLTSLAIACGASLGAYLVNYISPVFGSRILALFLLSAVLRAVVVKLLFPRLKDDHLAGVPLATRTSAARAELKWALPEGGIYHHLEIPPEPLKVPEKIVTHTLNSPAYEPVKVLKPDGGLVIHHKLRDWPDIYPGFTRVPTAARSKSDEKSGLFYHHTEWAQYHQASLEQILKVRSSESVEYYVVPAARS